MGHSTLQFFIENSDLKPKARERKHRLPANAYRGEKNVSFTLCIARRRPCFLSGDIVDAFKAMLAESLEGQKCTAPIYCFMPDHLHVLARGTEPTSSVIDGVDYFKWKTSTWFETNRPGEQWQKNYHDHIVRGADDWRRHALYILNNPVRACLVGDAFEFANTGSIGYEFGDFFREMG